MERRCPQQRERCFDFVERRSNNSESMRGNDEVGSNELTTMEAKHLLHAMNKKHTGNSCNIQFESHSSIRRRMVLCVKKVTGRGQKQFKKQ